MTLESEALNIRWGGVVHRISNEYERVSHCGHVLVVRDEEMRAALTLDPVDCVMCLGEDEQPDITYRCKCSWVGGDPDYHKGKPTCPACWHHDRRRVAVTPSGR